MTTRIPSLAETIGSFVTSAFADTYHILPGIVTAYYGSTEEADIQIAIDDPRFDVDTDEREDEPWPVYPRVKIAWPRMGGYTIKAPLSVGDKVQCFFQDLDDSAFRTTGQSGPAPRTRRFGSDAVFCLPFDVTDAGTTASAGVMVLGNVSGSVQIQISQTEIDLGVGATDHVAKAETLDTVLEAAVQQGIAAAVAGDGGHAALTAMKSYLHLHATDYAANLVKAK